MFKELFEAKPAPFDIIFELFKGDELMFTTRAANGADQIEKKLKQKKYKGADRVMRNIKGDHEDVTNLFIRK